MPREKRRDRATQAYACDMGLVTAVWNSSAKVLIYARSTSGKAVCGGILVSHAESLHLNVRY